MDSEHPEAGFWAVTREGGIVTAALNRPNVRNALNFVCWQELDALLAEIDDDPKARVLIITGSKDVFSAGGDMKNPEPRGEGLMSGAARLGYLQTVLARLARLSIPTIAAVEGPVVGVAWGLVLTCDFIIAGAGTKFMAPFAQRSLVPDGGIAFHLVKALGRLRATDILLGGRAVSPMDAFTAGLVTEVAGAGEALSRAVELAGHLARPSRDTTALTLKALRRAEHIGHRDYLDAEFELAALNLHNPDVAAARMSFKQPVTDESGTRKEAK